MRDIRDIGLRTLAVAAVAATAAGGLSAAASAAPAAVHAAPAAQTFTTPALAEGNPRFLDAAVRDLLGRASTPADRDRWLGALNAGQPREAFAGNVARTPEWTSVVVADLYAQVFGRAPDAGGLTHWSTQLGRGVRTADLGAHLYGSSEFYTASGSTPGGYVDRLYLGILHRLPDAGGRAHWVGQLQAGTSRSLLARLIFLSLEGNGERVDTLYGRLLNRASDPGGRAYWSRVLVDTDDLVLAGLVVGSAEYLAAAQTRFQSGTVTTAPGTTVLVAPHVAELIVDLDGYGSVTVRAGGPIPEMWYPVVVSLGGADGFAVGKVNGVSAGPNGTMVVRFMPADLTDVLLSVDVRSTVELPRDAMEVPAPPSGPACDDGSAELDAAHRLTSDVGFDGRLTYDRDTVSYDVAAVVSVSSNLTAIMSADARTSGCARTGASWSADWRLGIAAGPIDIPLVVDIDGTFDVEASFGAGFRSSTTASVPCRIGFTAHRAAGSNLGPRSELGCDTLDGRSGAEPAGAGRAVDHTDISIDARIGTPLDGVATSGHLEPTVTTSADFDVTPWWTVDLAVDGSTVAEIRLNLWGWWTEWATSRIADRRLARSPDGSVAPRPLAVATGWLRRGAVGEAYTMDLAATGGLPGYGWTASGLPAGLSVTAGRITGTPTAAGTPSVTLTATDAEGQTATRSITLLIGAGGSSTAYDRITHGDGISGLPQLSGDGRHLVFGSRAANLVPGDDNGVVDVFTFDQATGVLIRITKESALSDGDEVPPSESWAISADGRYVAFESRSPLVPGDLNDLADIFVWDRTDRSTVRLTDGDGRSRDPSISADGSVVAFESEATDLVAGETRTGVHVYLWTRSTGSVTHVSSGSSVSLSGDGSHASFNSAGHLTLMSLTTGVLTVVSDRDAWQPADLSADGRFVAYVDRGDLNVWRWDRATGVSTLIGGQTFVSPSITSDGGSVAFEAHRTIDGLPRQDVLLWHAATGTIEQLTSGAGRSNEPSTSADGSTIAFYSTTTHLVPNDTNGFADVFVWHRPNVSQ